MVDHSLIQAIKILNNPNTNKSRTCNDWKYYQLRRIDKRNRKLNSWDKISPKPDFVGKKEQAIDDKKVQNGSRKAEFEHSLAERIKKGTDCAYINVYNEGIYLL